MLGGHFSSVRSSTEVSSFTSASELYTSEARIRKHEFENSATFATKALQSESGSFSPTLLMESDNFSVYKANPNRSTYRQHLNPHQPQKISSGPTMAVSNPPAPSPTFPNPTYLFSAIVNLGKSLAPIPMLEGGVRIVEPITGGGIHGPGLTPHSKVESPLQFS